MYQNCYGKEFGKKEECKACKIKKTCKDAVYPDPEEKIAGSKKTKSLSIQGIDNIYENYNPEQIKSEASSEVRGISSLFAELLIYVQNDLNSVYRIFYIVEKLKEIIDVNPKTLQIALIKICHPELSYQQIADIIGCTKINIFQHLAKSKEIFPEIDNAFIIDKRKYPIAKRRKRKVFAIVKAAL